MVLKINNVDITDYISGVKWSRNDIDGASAGRTLDGLMHRDRVAIKIRWDITCRPLTASELATVLQLIQPEFVSVTYTDPTTNTQATGSFYSNNVPASYMYKDDAGVERWSGVSFPLVQR